MRLAIAISAAALVLACAGCGGSDTSDNSIVGYNYWFLGAAPYELAGEGAEDPAVRQAVSALLINRVVDFAPSLSITVYPAYSESTGLSRLAATSYVGTYIGPDSAPAPGLPVLRGLPDYAGGRVVIGFDRDGLDRPAEVELEYAFDEAEARALVDFMTDWRYEEFPSYGISVEAVTAEVVIRGLAGASGEITCRQNLHCVASHWIVL